MAFDTFHHNTEHARYCLSASVARVRLSASTSNATRVHSTRRSTPRTICTSATSKTSSTLDARAEPDEQLKKAIRELYRSRMYCAVGRPSFQPALLELLS
ncbi:uncharacterized protein UMAG_06475 [Mycosarcoma maydis]|uniref:Uncharacterized protein n=1 Tax=Mycosarcoma maydis TaxID=5270 RepID=A0A0D1CCM7_MYCMD|nr:uncharacterized protein UMAG_06475 [Ustilago maydis 521]KIS70897.1 hypothetical protein UMAG_06475 [Ustilago maydis 521]|eukprot:XP_011387940.1 hypothetical protein UMAG_06475 [Ustilago maydis 521]